MGGLEPWMGQVGVAGVLSALLFFLGRVFVNSQDRRVTEATAAHTAELDRLTRQHERELGDMRKRAEAWEATANRREAAVTEAMTQNGRLQAQGDTTVQLMRALREATTSGRELGPG